MVKKASNDQTVQETNDSSILSKTSITQIGYFDDPYLKLFTTRKVRRTPLIHRGYYIRAKAIDYALCKFLEVHQSEGRTQIVSLGAGFDSSFFRLQNKSLLNQCTYIEIDFPDVIRRKINLIDKHDVLKELIGEFSIQNAALISKHYKVLPCDLTKFTHLEKMLTENQIDFSVPTLLFSECVLTYVEYENAENLLTWIKNKFINSVIVVYEQVKPDDAFGLVMLKHFQKIQSPLKRIHLLRTVEEHKKLFNAIGYELSIGFDMNYFYRMYLNEEEQERMCRLEIFDEFEEWHLKCSHYCVVAAFQGSCVSTATRMFPWQQVFKETAENSINFITKSYIKLEEDIKVYGHAIGELSDNKYFVSGGFGVTAASSHEKLETGIVLQFIADNHVPNPKVNIEIGFKRMFHTMTGIGNNMLFLYGGRISPKQACSTYGIYQIDDSVLKPVQCFTETGVTDKEPKGRWRHAAAKMKDKIYIYGGRTGDCFALDDLWSFVWKSGIWKQEDVLNLPACHSHSLNTWKDKLVVFGGLNERMEALNQFHLISVSDEHTTAEELNFTPSLPSRYSHTAHVVKDTLIVVGGVDPSCEHEDASILVISLKGGSWKPLTLPPSDPERPFMLHNHCSILRNESKIVVVSGGGNCFSFGTHFNEDPAILNFSENDLAVEKKPRTDVA